ncbi:MAG: transcription elongation factor subunit Spt4 [Candidatus Micrarchaeia archaeon]
MVEKACKRCRLIISQGDVCPLCGSTELTTKWSGYVVVLDAEKSEIAKKLGIKVNGRYALNIND